MQHADPKVLSCAGRTHTKCLGLDQASIKSYLLRISCFGFVRQCA